jgi:hypothetical protein
MKKFDKFWWGFGVGIIAPLVVLTFILMSGDFDGSFGEVLKYTHKTGYLSVLIRPAMLANLAFFVFFFNLNYMKFCRGVIIGTLIYGLYIALTYLF